MADETIDYKEDGEEDEQITMATIGSFRGLVRLLLPIEDSSAGEPEPTSAAASEETMLLWGLQQPTLSKLNAFARQSSHSLHLDACGHSLCILQSPSSLGAPGVTGSVMWDSGVILAKFLEHAVDTGSLLLQGKKVVELGSGCGLVGCIAALLGAHVFLTDRPDRLRLLKKNVETNLGCGELRGSATVDELIWGDDPDQSLITPLPDFVLGSDVIYSEEAVEDLLSTLLQLCGNQTTILLSGELRNDIVLECFLEAAMKNFTVGRVLQSQWHPDYCSQRIVMYALAKK